MALVSPGVQVTVTNENFFIPAAASAVPLLFITTAENKTQPSGLPAAGTNEHNVLRVITSAEEALRLYGEPRFITDFTGQPHHGDARNEYGLMTLFKLLELTNRVYVVRANVNLNDNIDDIIATWDLLVADAGAELVTLAQQYIEEYNLSNGYIPSDPNYKQTLTVSELISLARTAMANIWDKYSYRNLENEFFVDLTATPYDIYGNGYDQPPTGQYIGFEGMASDWTTNGLGTVVATEWTPNEAADMLQDAADDLKLTVEFKNLTSLGADDAARRLAIVTALQASINNPNAEFLEDVYDFDLIAAPGFYEATDELNSLAQRLRDEVFVVGDVPFNMSPSELVNWADTSSDRQYYTNLAYWYGHGLTTNIDGREVFVPSSLIALRQIIYNDTVAERWNAPAGTQRGQVQGITRIGYVTGRLGYATTFVEANLTDGERDNLYKNFTNINLITRIPNRGILILGEKTSTSSATPLSAVSAARTVAYIKRQIRRTLFSFLHQPNNADTRNNVKRTVDAFLSDIMTRGGLYDFVTLCDESNNTPQRIANKELWIDIAIKPMQNVEFIYAPIRVLDVGAEL